MSRGRKAAARADGAPRTGATPLQGGVPITYEGKVIGAIGVSGNTPREDEEIALAGAAVAATALAATR